MNENQSLTESTADEWSAAAEVDAEPAVRVLVANEQSTLTIDESQLKAAVQSVWRESSYDSGVVSVAVVDDPTIHELNRQYLGHDYPTDVLSFVLEDRQPYLEGELVLSTDTASRNAIEYDWPASSELLLYLIHGALHLVGYRDQQPDEIAAMRSAEAKHLRALGVAPPGGRTRPTGGPKSTESSINPVGDAAIKSVGKPVGNSVGESGGDSGGEARSS